MPIDAGIYSAFAPPVKSVADIQNALVQQQQNALGLQKAQQDMADSNALRAAYRNGADPSTPEGRQSLIQAAPLQAPAIFKSQADLAKSNAETDKFGAQASKAKAETAKANIALYAQKLVPITDPSGAADWYDEAAKNGVISPAVAEQKKAAIPQDPQGFAKWKTDQLLEGVSIHDQLQMQQQAKIAADNNATSRANNQDTNATHLKGVGITQAGENARSAAARQAQYTIAGFNPDGSQKAVTGPDGQIDIKTVAPEDLAAAYRYKTDGTFPPNMGRGVQGAAEGRKIRAIASALDAQAGDSPEDARIRQLAAKGDVAAINQMRKREVQIGANVKNFDFNANQVLDLSQKVDRSGVPLVNAWINAGRRSITGNPELAAFDTAVKTTVNEFAQIVGGTTAGASTEGEKKKAEALLNAQKTPEQIIATINQMRIESHNRMQSFQAQRAESMPTNAPRTAAPSSAPTGWKVIR